MLKEQIEVLLRDNVILKRAVAIQHERQKENDERNQEVQQLKQLVVQYQEQLRTLEVTLLTSYYFVFKKFATGLLKICGVWSIGMVSWGEKSLKITNKYDLCFLYKDSDENL